MTNNTSDTIGCDLGDKRTEICVLHADGTKEQHSIRTTREAFRNFFARPPAHVVIEVGAQSRWVLALLNDLNHRVTVANPRRVKLISASDSKMDQHDAELLARLGRADVVLLAPVQHRAPRAQTDLAVAKARDLLVATRTRLINHVRGVLKGEGKPLPRCTAESFARKTRDAIPAALVPALGPIYETLLKLDEQIREHDRSIERIAKRYPDVDVLSQPRGVGVLTALVFILTLEDKERFASSRSAGAFIGLRPRKSQTGNSDPQLHITKAGDPFLRKLLVGSANYILGPFGKDSDLRRWGLTLAKRGGKNAKKRATVAVARKLAVLMHRLWVTGEVYQPLGYHHGRQEQPAGAAA
jgi:transposase